MKVYELIPTNGRKSFYGKAKYEDRLGDDDSWSFILRDIIYNYQFKYKNEEE